MRKVNYFTLLAGLFFTIHGTIGTSIIASASASQISVQISPLILEYTLNPGQSQEGFITFYNPSDTPQTISPQVWDFAPSDEIGGLRIFRDPNWQFSASKWILFDDSLFKLEPGTERLLPFTIVVPKEAEPGSHYAALFGESESQVVPGVDLKETQITPEGRVKVHVGAGTLILVNIPEKFLGEETSYGGNIVSFEIHGLTRILDRSAPIDVGWVGDRPLTFMARFQNTGVFHQKPQGVIEVFNILGKKVATLPIASQRVLPGAIIQFKSQWRSSSLFGPYHAKLTFFYGRENQQKFDLEKGFLVFSTKLLGLMCGGIVVVLGMIIFQKRGRT